MPDVVIYLTRHPYADAALQFHFCLSTFSPKHETFSELAEYNCSLPCNIFIPSFLIVLYSESLLCVVLTERISFKIEMISCKLTNASLCKIP